MDHAMHVLDAPDSVENFHNFIFSRKNFRFSSAKISDYLFLVIDHKFRIPPYFQISPSFPCFCTFLPMFHQNYYFPPTFTNFPPVLEIFTCFLHTFCVFRFPPTLTMMHLCITQCTYWTLLPLFGMGFHWQCDCSPVFTLTHSTSPLKLLFLAVLGSGALLSSNLEEALHKFM